MAPANHTHEASDISDSTTLGRAILTLSDPSDVRTAIGAAESDHTHNYAGSEIAGGTATSAAAIATTQKSDSVNYQIPFVSSVTAGDQNLYTDSAAHIVYNPSTNTLTTTNIKATTVTATLSGNAETATKLGTSTVGSTELPIYLNEGTATAITQANLRIGLFGSTAIGSALQPIYLAANGVPTAITGAIENDTTGNADSASTVATTAENTGTTSRYILFANSVSGNQALKTDTGLTYHPTANALTVGSAAVN